MTRMVASSVAALALLGCDVFDEEVAVTASRGMPESSEQRSAPDLSPKRPTDPPIPKDVAFVGSAGTDPFGRPLSRPDSTVLLALLRARRFADLDTAFEHMQSAFERDPSKEAWPEHAMNSFAITDPTLGPLLDAWVTAAPKSFGALASRGAWKTTAAWAKRGTKTSDKTTQGQFDALASGAAEAISDYDAALRLRPRTVAVMTAKQHLLRGTGAPKEELRRLYDQSLEVCPTCFAPRAAWVLDHAPRWGGSKAQMLEAAKFSPAELEANPALALVPAYIEFDACRTVWKRDGKDAAVQPCEAAVSRGPVPRISCRHGDLLVLLDRHSDAMQHFEAGLEVDPQNRACIVGRHWVHKQRENFEAAAEDILLARRLDPTNLDIDKPTRFILERLRYDAREAGKAGDDAKDRRLRALANAISPGSGDPQTKHGLSGTNLAALQERVAKAPRDLALHRKLDQALAREQRFAEIVKMWDTFLTEQPDHAEALLERAGARWHGGDKSGGRADAKSACELGSKPACRVAAQMK